MSSWAGPLGAFCQDRLPVSGPSAVHLHGSQEGVQQSAIRDNAEQRTDATKQSHRALSRQQVLSVVLRSPVNNVVAVAAHTLVALRVILAAAAAGLTCYNI